MRRQRIPGRSAGIADREARRQECGDQTVRHYSHRTVHDRCVQNASGGGDACCAMCELEGK